MTLAVGDTAPDFTTRNQYGEQVSLAALRGARGVLFFYPWAFSGICRGELTALREDHARFTERGARLIAVSCDAMFSLRAYADAEGIAFDLLSDHWPHGAIARAYGVFDDQAGCALRGSYVVDQSGTVRYAAVSGIGEPRDTSLLLTALDQVPAA